MNDFLDQALREVDELTPGSAPIAPPRPVVTRPYARMVEGLRRAGFVASPTTLQWRHPDGRVVDEEVLFRGGAAEGALLARL